MKAIPEMQILERFRSKRKFNKDVQGLYDNFETRFGDGNEVIPFAAEAVIEVCKEKDWNIPEKQHK